VYQGEEKVLGGEGFGVGMRGSLGCWCGTSSLIVLCYRVPIVVLFLDGVVVEFTHSMHRMSIQPARLPEPACRPSARSTRAIRM
jgi:hypothetical protein